MKEVQYGSLTDHCVVIEILLQTFPQFERKLVKWFVSWKHVIRPDDGRVAPNIARPKPAFLQNGYIPDAVDFGKVIGSRQAMATTANNDDIIFWLGLRISPDRFPTPIASQPFYEYFETGIAHSTRYSLIRSYCWILWYRLS